MHGCDLVSRLLRNALLLCGAIVTIHPSCHPPKVFECVHAHAPAMHAGTNKAGDTALHIAALKGHVGACRGLVDGGADPLRRNAKNRRPREQVLRAENDAGEEFAASEMNRRQE